MDRRRFELRLSRMGAAAMSEASVLDPRRVAALLAHLPPEKRQHAVAGIALLAEAADAFQATHPRRKRW
jgi:hypothetical protein